MKILAIDDDEFILELLPALLDSLGYGDVTVCPSGPRALALLDAAESPFDCVLLDIQMPGMDGIEVCARLRELPDYHRTPIVMLTAMTARAFVDRAFAAGATDYVTKPFDRTELGARLRVVAQLAAARRAQDLEALTETPHGSDPDGGIDGALENVRNLIDNDAFHNYLAQLSRAAATAAQVLAIQIDGIDKIEARASSDELGWTLRTVATTITETLSAQGLLFSYLGRGMFAVCLNSPGLNDPGALEFDLQTQLDDQDLTLDDGRPVDIEVSVGRPVRPVGNSPETVDRLIERVVARAAYRAEEKSRMRKAPNIRGGTSRDDAEPQPVLPRDRLHRS